MAFFNIRQWIDRISEHPNRRTLTNVEDATDVKTYDLSRAEGNVSVQGTALTAANLNDLENRIGSAFTAVENAMPKANPAETATGSLTKLKVDGTVYEVEGGGGEPQTSTIEDVEVASFSDGADNVPVSELIVDINPVQDLHGLSAPYPAGGGKNKLPMTVDGIKSKNTAGSWSGNVYAINGLTFTILTDSDNNVTGIKVNGTASAQTFLCIKEFALTNGTSYILSGCPSGGSTVDGYWLTIAIAIDDIGNGKSFTASSSTYNASIYVRQDCAIPSGGITFYPMIRLASETDASFAPYSNICPISGWNGCVITRCGTNIWDGDFESGKFNISTGAEVSDSNFIRSKNFIKVKPDTVGYVKFDNPRFIALFYDENKTYTTHYSALGSGGGYISIPSDAHYMKFYSQESTNQNDISINYPTETDEDYHAYVGSKYQKYFEGLIAGTYGFVDLGSLEYSMLSVQQGTLFRGALTTIKRTTSSGILPNIICPIYRTTAQTDRTEERISQPTESNNVDIIDSSYTSVSDFKTAMSGVYLIYELATPTTPTITQEQINMLISAFNADLVCVVFGQEVYVGSLNVTTGLLTITHGYELATPTTVQLTPVQVKTLLGNNNIFVNTGNIRLLEYFKTGCENIAKLVEAYSERDGIQTVLLEATDWDTTTNTITVDVTGVTATSNQEILPLPATSAANIANNKALQSANLMDYGQAEGQIILYAENIPSVDLSIRVIVRA